MSDSPNPNPYKREPYRSMGILERDRAVRQDHPDLDDEIKASGAKRLRRLKPDPRRER